MCYMRLNRMIRSRKAAVEWYSWFMLFATMALLITALVAFVIKNGAISYSSLGEAAITTQDLIFKKEMQLRLVDKIVDSAANKAIRNITLSFGISNTDARYTFYNGVPILIKDGTRLNILDVERAYTYSLLNYLSYESRKFSDKEKALIDNLEYDINSVSIVNKNTIYGFNLKKKKLSKDMSTGKIDLWYFPDFKYQFQNYELSDTDLILNEVSKVLLPELKDESCNLDRINVLFNAHNTKGKVITQLERYSFFANSECLRALHTEYTFEEYYIEDMTKFKFDNPTLDNCKILICVQDNDRLISGVSHGGYFKVGYPVYMVAMEGKLT
jgi:hypothetical protein